MCAVHRRPGYCSEYASEDCAGFPCAAAAIRSFMRSCASDAAVDEALGADASEYGLACGVYAGTAGGAPDDCPAEYGCEGGARCGGGREAEGALKAVGL